MALLTVCRQLPSKQYFMLQSVRGDNQWRGQHLTQFVRKYVRDPRWLAPDSNIYIYIYNVPSHHKGEPVCHRNSRKGCWRFRQKFQYSRHESRNRQISPAGSLREWPSQKICVMWLSDRLYIGLFSWLPYLVGHPCRGIFVIRWFTQDTLIWPELA